MALNKSSPSERRTSIDDLLNELTVWTPRERAGTFRAWLRGSLSLVHLHVLTVLEDGPLPMSRLADALDVSVASATGIVDRMEDRKLVHRSGDPIDRRIVLVHATRRGQRVFDVLAKGRRAHLLPIVERMSDAEITGFLTGLRAMRRIRAELGDRAGHP
ncbi:MAG: MarR family winged helix-turn-helix transcriptional regulator [Candidatus Limnocylindrales bacterium]